MACFTSSFFERRYPPIEARGLEFADFLHPGGQGMRRRDRPVALSVLLMILVNFA